MPPPTPLAISTSSLTRLLHEESTYASELAAQMARAERLEASLRDGNRTHGEGEGQGEGEGDENAEWRVRQERQAIEETKAVFPSLRARIEDAVGRVESEMDAVRRSGKEGSGEEIARAEEAVRKAREREREREKKEGP